MTTVKVVSGDITSVVPVDAIVTLINSSGAWFGGVDSAIRRSAGGHYHSVLSLRITNQTTDGDTFVVKGQKISPGTSFRDVIFVIDDLKVPLAELVKRGLIAAEDQRYHSVALPLMRTGVMLGMVEKTLDDATQAMVQGVQDFRALSPQSLLEINIVVYSDPHATQLLEEHLSRMNS